MGRLQRMAGVLARLMHHFVTSVPGTPDESSIISSLRLHALEFEDCVARGKGVIEAYTGRGFLTRILTANRDARDLAEVDVRLTKCLNDMQAALHIRVLEMQKASYESLSAANAAIAARIDALGPRVRL